MADAMRLPIHNIQGRQETETDDEESDVEEQLSDVEDDEDIVGRADPDDSPLSPLLSLIPKIPNPLEIEPPISSPVPPSKPPQQVTLETPLVTTLPITTSTTTLSSFTTTATFSTASEEATSSSIPPNTTPPPPPPPSPLPPPPPPQTTEVAAVPPLISTTQAAAVTQIDKVGIPVVLLPVIPDLPLSLSTLPSPSLVAPVPTTLQTVPSPALEDSTVPGASTVQTASQNLSISPSYTNAAGTLAGAEDLRPTGANPGEPSTTLSVDSPGTGNAQESEPPVLYAGAMGLSGGKTAGIAVGSAAGVAFIITIALFFYKWRKGTLPKSIPNTVHRVTHSIDAVKWRVSTWIPRAGGQASEPTDRGLLSSSPVEPESRTSSWDYTNTFSAPAAIVHPTGESPTEVMGRSIGRLLKMNPLKMNPLHPRSGTPNSFTMNRRSFVSSLFRSRSTASSTRRQSVLTMQSEPPDMQEVKSVPPLPNAYVTEKAIEEIDDGVEGREGERGPIMLGKAVEIPMARVRSVTFEMQAPRRPIK